MDPEPPAMELYLHTSPEFAMKRLLCRGLQAIYQITPVFRQGERGPLHNPEFAMAEWYRAGWGYQELMAEAEEIIREVVGPSVLFQGREVLLQPPLRRLPVREALERAGVEWDSFSGLPAFEWRERFYREYVSKLDPWLRGQGALFLTDFPAPLALLARGKPENQDLAERFELIVAGLALMNGCTELADPAEIRQRFEEDRQARDRRGRRVPPLPQAFLHDLETLGLPYCAGLALGLDRLAMIATGKENIRQVQAFDFSP
jgi:lysyl-tRNA synthetase class 2